MPATILVVDDEPDMAELIRFNLKQHGYEVAVAHDGPEGLKLARELRPDLVLLDVMMEGLSGLAVCEILRRDAQTAHIPVIMLTALATALGRANGIGAGARDYVTKPFSKEDLLRRVDDAITTSRAWSEAIRGAPPDSPTQRRPRRSEVT